jgi:hypothetical protein
MYSILVDLVQIECIKVNPHLSLIRNGWAGFDLAIAFDSERYEGLGGQNNLNQCG